MFIPKDKNLWKYEKKLENILETEDEFFSERQPIKKNFIGTNKNFKKGDHIPCLLLKSKKKENSNKFLFYFHGNAEDIFNCVATLEIIKNILPYHVISIEYPGYSLYYEDKSSDTIEVDSLLVFDFFVNALEVNPKDIAIIGRSIGSGPGVYLTANRNPAALVLISPFKSVRDTAEHILGSLKFLVSDRFINIKVIKDVTCPLLLIHGQADKLIPFQHSVDLSKNTGGPFDLILPENMDHNNWLLYDDFIDPLCAFFKRFNLLNKNDKSEIFIPDELFEIPDYILKTVANGNEKDYISLIMKLK